MSKETYSFIKQTIPAVERFSSTINVFGVIKSYAERGIPVITSLLATGLILSGVILTLSQETKGIMKGKQLH